MATRVLNTIKDKEKIIGFRIICSLPAHKGVRILSMRDAREFYKMVEKFENVRYVGNGQWEGIECGLTKFPVQDKVGNFIKCDEKLFILGKMYSNDEMLGYKIMDLNGDVSYLSVADTLDTGAAVGFINAKIVEKDKKCTISAIRGSIPSYRVKSDSPLLLKDKNYKANKDISDIKGNKDIKDYKGVKNIIKQVDSDRGSWLMDDKNPVKIERYKKLSELFAKKEKKEATDLDIAKEVGCTSGQNLSQKIHEYLGEPLTMPDKDILVKLYQVYKAIQMKETVKQVVQNPDNTSNIDFSQRGKSSDVDRMQALIDELTPAAKAYYNGEDEIMSNFEYDKKYNELEELEKKTGIILSGSLTQNVGFEVKSKLAKVRHPSKMLSLDKTKDRQELANSLGGQDGFLGWKLDGLTVVVIYENGELKSAVTRGDGSIGEDITHNAKFFSGIPQKISYKDRLAVRGEALISYKNFDRINSQITNIDDKYKNARNLASGSVRQLDSKIAKERQIHVVAFTVVEGFDNLKTYTEKLEAIRPLGFDIVPYIKVNKDTTIKGIEYFEGLVKKYKYPTDGLVITIDDIAYGEMLGTTSKFPRNSKAFKWKDEEVESTLIDIDWSVGRTGAITPVAVFKPIEIDGTTVSRASLHNVSVFKEILGPTPHVGQKVWVIKSNMIIPTITRAEK